MGNCIPKKSNPRRYGNKTIPADVLCKYPRTGTVKIRFKNFGGRVTSEQEIVFNVTEPQTTLCQNISIEALKVFMSLCVLPGLDPKSQSEKKCQDHAFFFQDDKSFLVCLLDGHGNEGEKVVQFCEKIIEDLYRTQKAIYEVRGMQNNPDEFMALLTETCDKELKNKHHGVNAQFSGW